MPTLIGVPPIPSLGFAGFSFAVISTVGMKLNDPPLFVHKQLNAPVPGKCPPTLMRKVKWLTSVANLFGVIFVVYSPGEMQALLAILLVLPTWLSGVYNEYASIFNGYSSMKQFQVFSTLGIDLGAVGAVGEMLAKALERARVIAQEKVNEKIEGAKGAYTSTWEEKLASIRNETRGYEAMPTPVESVQFNSAAINAAMAVINPKKAKSEAVSQVKDEAEAKVKEMLAKACGQLLKTMKGVLTDVVVEGVEGEEEFSTVLSIPGFKPKLKEFTGVFVGKAVNMFAGTIAEKAGIPVDAMGLESHDIGHGVTEALSAVSEAKDAADDLAAEVKKGKGKKTAKVAPSSLSDKYKSEK